MRTILLISILALFMSFQASATVEDPAGGKVSGVTWPPSVPSLPAQPPCPINPGCLIVSLDLTGPQEEAEKGYTVQGRPLNFVVTVTNNGPTEVETDLSVISDNCPSQWFSWTSQTLNIPAGVARSEDLQVKPDINAMAGEYRFKVDASAKCTKPGSDTAYFKIQDYDYASETSVSGTGNFTMSKDVRSMNSGIKSDKDLNFAGSVDALVKNEYLVEQARGRTPNFQEQDAVDNYDSLGWGRLQGFEDFKSSRVFGGVGAKVTESFDLAKMDYKNQDFNLHQTGSLKKMAEFITAAEFTTGDNVSPGYFALAAKQSIPGQRSMKENEIYIGSFEIARRFIFRDKPTTSNPCFDGSCSFKPAISMPCFGGPCLTVPQPYKPACISGSCAKFVNNLNSFVNSA
jgi:hypothetical protein